MTTIPRRPGQPNPFFVKITTRHLQWKKQFKISGYFSRNWPKKKLAQWTKIRPLWSPCSIASNFLRRLFLNYQKSQKKANFLMSRCDG
jgi:hypothetical protein